MVQKNKERFKDLFIMDLANNHQGSLEHGKLVIESHAAVAKKHGVRAAIKFQFRDLPDFIHPVHQKESNNKHVPRFLGTKLSWEQFDELRAHAVENGMLTMCTPFDEASVERIVKQGFDFLKIASCSALDWPLIEAAASTGLPMVVSTGGLQYSDVDKVVSFLQHRGTDFGIMHCVSIYPTKNDQCNLKNIVKLKNRYRNIPIGWSTHEDPDNQLPLAVAISLGAEMFERHIGIATDAIKLNAYSSQPLQTAEWFDVYKQTKLLLGTTDKVENSEEQLSLLSLKRGVLLKRNISQGSAITRADVKFVFPCSSDQVSSGEFRDGMTANENLKSNSDLLSRHVNYTETLLEIRERSLKHAIHAIKALLNEADIKLNPDFEIEYSHHYGLENFRETGAVLITVFNKEYAKKLVVQLPQQKHPLHMHKIKDETFLVVYGVLTLTLNNEKYVLKRGEKMTVPPGVWHSFATDVGCIFEEISTRAIPGDSYYKDSNISNKKNAERKTLVNHWNGYNLSEKIAQNL